MSSNSANHQFARYLRAHAHCARRVFMALVLGLATSIVLAVNANAETRKLKLYYLHTGEKATIAFKKNGKFLPAGLKKVNYFLRDWRRNEPTRMDPNLLDLIWEVYRKSGSRDYVHVISGYRSPATNNMLRKRGRGVAKKSQHTLGKALDFFLPDVKLAKLRKIGLLKQVGGVGYYPKSGSPFVHMDTGSVRHWPRMTRKQLVKVFPNGKTLHVPTDGKPLPGYNQAVAAYNARKSSTKKVELAKGTEKERKSFFQRLAALRNNDDEDNLANTAPSPRKVKTTSGKKTADKTPKPTAPIDIPDTPDTPPALPALASIPVPRNAPRDVLLSSDNTVIAGAQDDVSDETLQEETLALAPIPRVRPQSAPTLLALATPSPVTDTSPGNEGLSTEPLELSANSETIAQTLTNTASANDQLRAQLIAQAKSQLRTKLLVPPRPGIDVGSNFQTALVSPQNTPGNANTTLTRSLVSAPTPTLEDTQAEQQISAVSITPAIDDNVITSGNIPLPLANPQNPPAIAPIDKILKNDGSIASPEPNPVALAALEEATRDEIAAVMAFPAKRPQLVASNSQVAQSANLSLALVDDSEDNLASPENLRTMMEKQARALVEVQEVENDEISPIILAAIPTPSPLKDEAPDKLSVPLPVPAVENRTTISQPSTQLAKLTSAPKPLDDLSQAWFEQKRTGKFVLAKSLTINVADELRAPAYGRAAIRQTPKTVLTAGFDISGSVQNALNFSGNAINYLSFTRFN